ncbi:MAG: DNA cytosine methyltransferase [Candidatus Bathyarchaeota archaeon]|nr:DNA cytosine methyltransferase [Candidatus Bathyarchaeum tardum]WGM89287.1 MAG: DNA cytosine methyltransferase [Candidatus Bathyarchaeum tardum]WNZ28430.1 MAG: DNA cytosine methyltransferase [Candidatus Bathyarchaeota archaeon]
MEIVSLFSGCGGLDLGFTNAGFDLVYANDNDKKVWETFEKNHTITIDKRSLFDIRSDEIPDSDGIIGGPPCQSWSLAGAMRGIKDDRGKLFHEYIRVLKDKQPSFFLAENVPGIVSRTHIDEFNIILSNFSKLGYNVSYKVLDARNYGVPQERRRVLIVGYRKEFGKRFIFPSPTHTKIAGNTIDGKKTPPWRTLEDAIGDLPNPVSAKAKNHANEFLEIPNHEYMLGSFSTIFMSRNRRKEWTDQSYTIQAGGRHAPLHPSSTEMVKLEKDKWDFKTDNPFYRRFSVRECARIQTFPDDFVFYYKNVADGYKMVGNAVPVKLAEAIANKIRKDLTEKIEKTLVVVQ